MDETRNLAMDIVRFPNIPLKPSIIPQRADTTAEIIIPGFPLNQCSNDTTKTWPQPKMGNLYNYCKRYHVVINFYSSNIQSRFLLIPDFTFWDLKVKMSLLFTNTNYLLLYVEAFQRSHKQMHHLFSMALLSTWLKEDNGFLEHFVQNMGSISLMGCWEKEGWIFLKFSTAQPYLLTRPSAMNKLRKFT